MVLTLADIERRVVELEQSNILFQRVDPAISLGTSLYELGNVPSCHIYNSGTDAIADDTFETITYNSTRFDTGQMADTTNNRININEGGIYLVIVQIKFTAHATDGKTRALQILVDNDDVIAGFQGESLTIDTHTPTFTCSTLWKMDGQTTGQLYFYTQAYQNSGGALNIAASTGSAQDGNNFMALKVADFGQL